uniref:BAG cochaperone 1 n=1 Tax=Sus scrofa TaxID=9823 RepID=A0ABB5UPW5_PIG
MKKKARPRSAGSEEVTRNEEVSRSEEVVRSEEAALSEEVARSEEMAAAGLSVTVTHRKSLKEMKTPLSALGIQNGCRIMLIGKKNSSEEEVELKKLKDLERSVEKIAHQLEELNKELTGIQQGFLAKDLQAEALCKLDRRIKATIEQFMKILEEIDTLILPENFKDSRMKRKGLVKRIQGFLAECDTVEQNICLETERLQSTNLALAD